MGDYPIIPPTGLPDADALHPRALAHLGDAVYELYIRQEAVSTLGQRQVETIHQYTIERVNAAFQAQILQTISSELTPKELEIVRRGRNLPVPASRRSNQAVYRQATGLEALTGYLYLSNPGRLQELLSKALLSSIKE